MGEWLAATVEDLVATVSSGGTPRAGDPRYYADDGIPFLKIDDLTRAEGRYVSHAGEYITEAGIRESAAKVFPAGTVLITMYGTMGLTKTLTRPMAANQAIAALIPPFSCDGGYLAHALSFRRAALERMAAQTTQPNISGTIVRRFRLPVPPLEEQRRIAEILDTVDETILATERVIAKLDDARRGLIEAVIPEDPMIALDSLAAVSVGFVGPTQMHYTSSERGVAFLRTGNIGKGRIRVENLRYVTSTFHVANGKSALRTGDVVVSRVGYTGSAAVIEEQFDGSNCANMIIIRPAGDLESDFLSLLFESRLISRQVEALTAGSAQPVLNIKLVQRLRVPNIGLDAQRDAVTAINGATERTRTENASLRKLIATRTGLAADLLSGRVRTVAA